MAGTTTYYGISYPTSTDYVKDGASAMQTIADGFDSAVAIPTYNNQTGTSYTFVLTDAGKTVTSNNASAVTFTIPPQASVAWANNTTLTVRNLGAGVVTIAGGSGVTVTNTAQTVAQYGEVKLIRTASNAWTVVPASGGASGLTLINATTISAQSTVQVNNCFTSTYENYLITYRFGTISAGDAWVKLQMTASGTAATTGYKYTRNYVSTAGGGVGTEVSNNADAFTPLYMGVTDATVAANGESYILSPNLANRTFQNGLTGDLRTSSFNNMWTGGVLDNTTQYDGFKFTFSGNVSGTIRVYGLAN